MSMPQKLIVCLMAVIVIGCEASKELDAPQPDATPSDQMIVTISPDMSIPVSDMTQPADDAELDDVGPDQADMAPSTDDMGTAVADAALDMQRPDAEPPTPPGPCPDEDTRTCTQLCETLTGCFGESTCLGLSGGDQSALLDACESSCAFNSSTREVLCGSEGESCDTILERLFMSDEALGTLCSGDFSESDRQACVTICARTGECAGDGTRLETEQSCRFQCLVQGSATVSECIAQLECDDTFEARVQACLQGRQPQAPLMTNCDALCGGLSNCQPPVFDGISAGTTQETCLQECATVLPSPASIACAGELNCALTLEARQACTEANRVAPSCEIGCRRILECAQDANPFGASADQLEGCISDCTGASTIAERQCSFDVECTPNFLENFYSCIDSAVP